MSDTRALLPTMVFLVLATTAQAASPDFQKQVAASQPVLWFSMNETTGVAVNGGSLGVDFNADYLGTPVRGNGTESGDKSVRFDGADDYLETDAAAPAAFTGNPTFSAEALFFVVPDGFATDWAPFLHWGGSDVDGTMKSAWFSFQHNNADRVYVGFYNGGLRTKNTVARGAWHHVVWIREGGGAANVGSTLYVDGAVAELENDPDLPADSSTPVVQATPFRIDRARDFTRSFAGAIDEVALYDRALTAEEVAAHFAALEPCQGDAACVDWDGGCKVCGRPSSAGDATTASDALAVLRAAVGTRKCNPCICDVDHSGGIFASDALLTLKFAVGQPVSLVCPSPA